MSATIDKMVAEKKLDIDFIQQGGKIALIPTTLDSARDAVAKLAAGEFDGPRPIFMIVAPYLDLSNWPSYYLLDTSDLRQRAIRYDTRLLSAFYEIMDIRDDYYRDRREADGGVDKDQYYYSYRHQLRDEDLSKIADEIHLAILNVDELIRILNSPECNPRSVFASIPGGLSRSLRLIAERSHNTAINAFNRASDRCKVDTDAALANVKHFDDFDYWMKLPIPVNALPASAIEQIEAGNVDIGSKKNLYAQYVFQHWIEHIDQIRCRLFFECLTPAQKQSYYNTIIGEMTRHLADHLTQFAAHPLRPKLLTYVVAMLSKFRTSTQTAPSEYSLSTRESDGTIIDVMRDQMVGNKTDRAKVWPRSSPFDITVTAKHCGWIGCVGAMPGFALGQDLYRLGFSTMILVKISLSIII